MVFRGFSKCTGKPIIPRKDPLIPPPWIGITRKTGISVISPIPPWVIPIVILVNRRLISLIYKCVNQSVTNVATLGQSIYPPWG